MSPVCLSFYLFEGYLYNGKQTEQFTYLVGNYQGLTRFFQEYVDRLCVNQQINISISQAWLCKYYGLESLSRAHFENLDLTNCLWSESVPLLIEDMNRYLDWLYRQQITQVSVEDVKRQLILSDDLGNHPEWIIIEWTSWGKPLKAGCLANHLVEEYQLVPFQTLSVTPLFKSKTIMYRINYPPFEQFNFNQVPVPVPLPVSECETKTHFHDFEIVQTPSDESTNTVTGRIFNWFVKLTQYIAYSS